MKKILILGAQGMLGHDLAEAFKNYHPILWDRDELDITNQAKVSEKFNEVLPEIVINAAAYTNVDGAEKEIELAYAINTDAVGYVALAAKEIGSKVVQLSTEYVFNGENMSGYNEEATTNPINVYGQSKAKGEKILIDSGVDYFLVRTSWLYGQAPQKGKPRGKNFIDTILEKARLGEKFQVVDDQWGRPTYTKDLAQGIKKLVANNYQKGIYHLVNEGQISWYGLACEALRQMNINAKINPCQSIDFPSVAKRPRYSLLNNNKFPKFRNWSQALAEYIQTKF